MSNEKPLSDGGRTFGHWLRRYRKEVLRSTQVDLGELVGYSGAAIGRYEQGNLKPSANSAEEMAIKMGFQEDQERFIDFALGKLRLKNSNSRLEKGKLPPLEAMSTDDKEPDNIGPKTFAFPEGKDFIIHLATRLNHYKNELKETIALFRILPFEFLPPFFSAADLSDRKVSKALGDYRRILRDIIDQGDSDNIAWWDYTIIGRTGDPILDQKTNETILQMYFEFPQFGNAPDTSILAFNPTVQDFGMILIGQLDIEVMRQNISGDPTASRRPVIKEWKCGYWLVDIVVSNGQVTFDNCLFTENENVLASLYKRFMHFQSRAATVEWTLNERMGRRDVQRIRDQFKGRQTAQQQVTIEILTEFGLSTTPEQLWPLISEPAHLSKWLCDGAKQKESPDEYSITWENAQETVISFKTVPYSRCVLTADGSGWTGNLELLIIKGLEGQISLLLRYCDYTSSTSLCPGAEGWPEKLERLKNLVKDNQM